MFSINKLKNWPPVHVESSRCKEQLIAEDYKNHFTRNGMYVNGAFKDQDTGIYVPLLSSDIAVYVITSS